MKDITFITGNQNKADYLAKYLGFPVKHIKLDLDELQSLNSQEIVEHKVKQAHELIKSPVIVEDVALQFNAMGKLPGPFIKHFVDEMSEQDICDLLNGKDRSAIASCVFGYYDGKSLKLFRGGLTGKIAESPRGENGYGWDKIFVPDGDDRTQAEMDEEGYKTNYLKIKPFEALKLFLSNL